jgi:hypothetical protein
VLADFQEAFERFLPKPLLAEYHSVTTPENTGDSALSESSHSESLLRIENAISANKDAGGDGVTCQKPRKMHEKEMLL